MRELRDRYLMDSAAQPTQYFDTPKVKDGPSAARLHMRDAIRV